jgi:hypothetical protein
MPLHKLRRAGGAYEAFSLAYIGSSKKTINGTTQTFSSESIGTVAVNRVIAVAVSPDSDPDITNVTIGGIAATQAVQANGGSNRTEIWYARVPSGTTADIVVSIASSRKCTIAVYRITTSTFAPANTDSATVVNGDVSVAATCPAGGAGIVSVSGDTTGTHTGTNYTGRWDIDNSGDAFTGGDFTASNTLTCENTSNNGNDKSMVYAAWAV